MFRFASVRKLASYFPILILAPLNFLAFTFERALRYVSQINFHSFMTFVPYVVVRKYHRELNHIEI